MNSNSLKQCYTAAKRLTGRNVISAEKSTISVGTESQNDLEVEAVVNPNSTGQLGKPWNVHLGCN